jgi:hypothetical protein
MYKYKGNEYEVFKQVKMKNPETREWDDAIIYMDRKGDLYVRERNDFLNKFKEVEEIPYHIKVMAKMFPIIKREGSDEPNLSIGEIKKFKIAGQNETIKMGHRVNSLEIIDNEDYGAIWVHVGNNYFKMIGLWPERTC